MMKRTSSYWPVVVLCGVGLVAGCDRAEDDATLGEKIDSAGARISRETADARQSATRAMESAGEKIESGVDHTLDSIDAKTENLQARAALEGEKLGEKLGDSSITVKAKSVLVADPELSALRIDVDTRDGVVTLRGAAGTAAAVNRATTLIRSIDGVLEVDNRLSVIPAG
jgi:hyperosmotically inducible protein